PRTREPVRQGPLRVRLDGADEVMWDGGEFVLGRGCRTDEHAATQLSRVGRDDLDGQAAGDRDGGGGLAGSGRAEQRHEAARRWGHAHRAAATARQIAANASGCSDAPPTRAPSMSGCPANPWMFSAFTEPPYCTRQARAMSSPKRSATRARTAAQASCA